MSVDPPEYSKGQNFFEQISRRTVMDDLASGPLGYRRVHFGASAIAEDPANTIPDEEFSGYNEGFELFKRLALYSTDKLDRLVLSSPDVFSLCMGLQPYISCRVGEARVLYQALEGSAAIDRFLLFNAMMTNRFDGTPESAVIFAHKEAVVKTLSWNQSQLGIQISEAPTDQEITKVMISLFNNPQYSHLVRGLLSGFPRAEAARYAQASKSSDPLPDLSEFNFNSTFSSIPSRDLEWINTNYGAPYLKYWHESKFPLIPKRKTSIKGFGLQYEAAYPISKDAELLCQKLLEIDRRLGVLLFVDSVRKTI